jgi:hypothetical protein
VRHRANPKFWQFYTQLPEEIQRLADEKYDLLKADPRLHPSTSKRLAGCGQFVSASIIVPPLSRMAQTSFGFGLVITASMTESLLDAADDSNEAPN